MEPEQKAQAIAALIIFIAVFAVAMYVAVRGCRVALTLKSRGNSVLFTLGLWMLLLWALRDVWHYGLFGTAFDLRVWLLGIPLYLWYQRLRGSATGP